MADAIERLYKLTVDANQAIAQLEKLNRQQASAAKGLDDFASSLKKVGAIVGGALAVDVVVDRFKQIVDGMDDVVKASQEVGVGAQALQELRYAAEASGASAETLDKGLQKLSQNLQGVDDATTDTAKALRAMGVTGADSADQAFGKIAEAFAKMPDGAQKTAIALDTFGKAGAQLIPTLNAGKDGLAGMAKEAHDLGVVIDEGTLKAAEHFNDQLDMLANLSKATAQQFIGGMLPALQSIASVLIDTKKGGDSFNDWGKLAGEMLLGLAKVATTVVFAFKDFGRALAFVGEAIANPLHIGDAWDSMVVDMARNNDKLSDTWVELDMRAAEYAKTQAQVTDSTGKATTATLKLADAHGKLKKSIDPAEQAMKDMKRDLDEEARSLSAAEKAYKDFRAAFSKTPEGHLQDLIEGQQKAAEEWNLTVDDAVKNEQIWRDMLDNGTQAQQDYARAMLNSKDAGKDWTEQQKEAAEELSILGQGFDDFFSALQDNTQDAAQAFERMIAQMIAALLKLWIQKAILNVGTKQEATGDAILGGHIIPFAMGGIVPGPTHFRLAGGQLGLMGERGPEAIMPLQRAADGTLGVRAATPPLHVQIQNFTDSRVTASRTSGGDLQVLIEATKKAIAADFRRGGNDVSRSAEAAWRLSRGAAAPF